MAAFISVGRLKQAIIALADWRGQVKQQTVAHVFPFLALLEKGVNASAGTQFEESDDFTFFNKYNNIEGDLEKPYFDPFTRQFRIASHPHSNIATARKGTFARSWNAADFTEDDGRTFWQLKAGFADTFRRKVLTKGSETIRLPAVDLAVWMFREEEFPDNSDSDTLIQRFKDRFKLADDDFNTLFQYNPEAATAIFSPQQIPKDEIAKLVRSLSLDTAEEALKPQVSEPKSEFAVAILKEDDPILAEVKALLAHGTSGIILRGAPGTGKSWYAEQIARTLTRGAPEFVFRIQFHPSFSYEDFFDGYVPSEETKSGFKIVGKTFRRAIEHAAKSEEVVVLIIDEINRGDTSRIFGESLTYIERGWRGVKFRPRLASEDVSIPPNLFVLATMNPHDRSITQLDMALLRRFDHVDVPPSAELANEFLRAAGMTPEKAELVTEWFNTLQNLLPFGLGHTFFRDVGDEGKLGLVWRYRILPFCQSILEFEDEKLKDVVRSYDALVNRLRGAAAAG
jgi:5-methylcytosine-specific restriction enzyme B